MSSGVVVGPSGEDRSGALIERPVWEVGPDQIRIQVPTYIETGEPLRGTQTIECLVRADRRLSACIATTPPPSPEDGLEEYVFRSLGVANLAVRLVIAPTDADGAPTVGKRVRITRDYDADYRAYNGAHDILDKPQLVNLPSAEALTAHYPRRALIEGVTADTRLVCVVDEAGVKEGCEIFFQVIYGSETDPGFADAALRLYEKVEVSPATRNGAPERAVVLGSVMWR